MNAHIPHITTPSIYQGYSVDHLRNKERNFFHRAQSLSVPGGHLLGKPPTHQGAFIVDETRLDSDQYGDLVKQGCLNKEFYTTPNQRASNRTLADEKMLLDERNAENSPVLRFYACKVDALPQEKPFLKENHRVRKFVIYYYTADDSIRVWENREDNAGFEQGIHLRRARYALPGNETDVFWHWSNLDIGVDVDLGGHKFHVYDCDDFTRYFYTYNGGTIGPPEECPRDPYYQWRTFINKPHSSVVDRPPIPPLSRFLMDDGKILRFDVVVDESQFPAGDVRRMCLKYYVYDDTMELTIVPKKNTGYDPVRTIIRRQKVPKNFYKDLVLEIGDKRPPEYYTYENIKIGETLLLFGRKITICDCDEFTKDWYRQKYGKTEFPKVHAPDLLPSQPSLAKQKHSLWHPLNLQGGFEDSTQNCLSLTPLPPRKNDLQAIVYDKEVLRFQARLVTQEPEDISRSFIFMCFLGDDTLAIMEQTTPLTPKRMFLARTKLAKHGTHNPPEYYTEQDFTIGSIHHICGRYFEIINCDEYVVNFAQSQPGGLYPPEEVEKFKDAVRRNSVFREAEPQQSLENVELRDSLRKLHRWYTLDHRRIYQLFLDQDSGKSGLVNAGAVQNICGQLGIPADEATAVAMMQKANGDQPCSTMEFTRFLHGVNMLFRPVPGANSLTPVME